MNQYSPLPSLLLVRHAPVAEQFHGICYGRSDVPLSVAGEQMSRELAAELALRKPTLVVHSGLVRSRALAEQLAARLGLDALFEPALQERDFGSWELQSWDAIHAAHGDDMLRMICQPESYRPGGGETTFEMRDRVLAWFEALNHDGPIIAITHGGPIAALRGTLRGLPVAEWLELIPRCGESVQIPILASERT